MAEGRRAMYYERIEDSKVRCHLCPHNCVIIPGRVGVCRARKNVDGDLYSMNYGKITSLALDPIEKKPLHRFHPGSLILSAGTFGCNLKCSFCQNWSIAHGNPPTADIAPQELVSKALEFLKDGNIGIAYTYNEPVIWYEFVYETAGLARKDGLVNVLVTNGFINQEPLRELLPYIDAMNIDLKGFTDQYYRNTCGGALDDVMKTIETASGKCHVEVTTLVVPGLNDSIREIEELSKWLSSISKYIPLHLSRYFPNYRMQDRPPTPVATLLQARDKAREYLEYVYLGNVW